MKRPVKSSQNQSDAEVSRKQRPLITTKYSVDDLVKKITPANRHDEIDFGQPVGRELL
jgi:antitoxin component of MazEF toxin-antitoxin module